MKQQGAALVIVMALLSGALILGVSSMNSALIDEKLAGNYRASVQSQMGGEEFLARVVSDKNKENLIEEVGKFLEDLEDGDVKKLTNEELNSLVGSSGEEFNDLIVNVSHDENEVKIEAWSTEDGAKSPTTITTKNGSGGGNARNSRSPFLACQRIRLTGSSLAASCEPSDESSDEVCSQNPSAFIPAESQSYDLLYNLGSDQGNGIFLEGDVQAYGSARSQRDIVLTGSSGIRGDAYAQSAIIHGGGTSVWGEEELTTESSLQRCELFLDAARLSVQVDNLKQLYGDSIGNITMGASPSSQWALTPEGLFFYDEESGSSGPPVLNQCYFWDLRCIANFFLNFFRSLLGFDICNNEFVTCDSSQAGWTKHSDVVDNAIVVDDLTLRSNPTFIVSGLESDSPENPVRLRMVVEGEFSVGGGGNGLVIEDNAQLEVFVKGKTSLNSNLQMGDGSASRDGQAPLTINSSYSGNDAAVTLNGNSHLVGNVYAPGGSVSIYSSRVTGSIWAKEINSLDSSRLIFNEVNTVADSQSVETGSDSDESTSLEWDWQ